MLFNSFDFALFFAVVCLIYALIPAGLRTWLLVLASCVFYCHFIPAYLLILFAVILIDYYAALCIEKQSGAKRQQILFLSIIANLGILAVFKYYNFFIENINTSFQFFGYSTQLAQLKWVLPIGLSFHVFQSLSYTIEVYKGRQHAEKDLLIYSLYVLYFPQLVAGPIERPQNLLQQFKNLQAFREDNIKLGLKLITTGLFKKCIIADNLVITVDRVFADLYMHQGLTLWIAIIFFAFQIFCDFSGYSDIARGVSRFFNVELMINFNRPYFSKSISEFWRRWHISLSTWFRDYVYISLGGNRGSQIRTSINLIIVFSLSGLWHGASWNFIIWGLLHGIYVSVYGFMKDSKILKAPLWVKISATNFLVLITWVFFRAKTLPDATYFIENMFYFSDKGLNLIPTNFILEGFILIFLLVIFQFFEAKQSFWQRVSSWSPIARFATYTSAPFLFYLFGQFNLNQFIYFQF